MHVEKKCRKVASGFWGFIVPTVLPTYGCAGEAGKSECSDFWPVKHLLNVDGQHVYYLCQCAWCGLEECVDTAGLQVDCAVG